MILRRQGGPKLREGNRGRAVSLHEIRETLVQIGFGNRLLLAEFHQLRFQRGRFVILVCFKCDNMLAAQLINAPPQF